MGTEQVKCRKHTASLHAGNLHWNLQSGRPAGPRDNSQPARLWSNSCTENSLGNLDTSVDVVCTCSVVYRSEVLTGFDYRALGFITAATSGTTSRTSTRPASAAPVPLPDTSTRLSTTGLDQSDRHITCSRLPLKETVLV